MTRTAAPILFVNAGAERGGAEVVLLTLLRHLDRQRFPPHVCCLRDGPLVGELRQHAGVEATIIPSGSFRQILSGVAAVGRLRALALDRRVALFHCNGTGAHIYGGLAARRLGVPSIYHVHDVPDVGWTGQGLVGRVARLVPAAAAVTPSRFLAERLAERPARAARILSISNGLDGFDADHPVGGATGAAVRREGGRPDGRAPVAVWVGRLQRWKGAHVFLRAAALVRRAIPDARFIVVGGTLLGLEPEYAAELRDLARALDLESAVLFAGHQPSVAPFLRDADVVVHSSIAPEPFGLVILEAMLAGKPVVASAEGGPLEIVEPELTGLLVPPGDAEALGAALLRLFQDSGLRARMGAAGRARAEQRFSAKTMAREFETLYAALLWGTDARRGEAA